MTRSQPQTALARQPFWLLFPALLLAVAFAYYPAWQGGLVWDDDAHVTHAALRSLDGLFRIWTDIGATQQYYPLTHTAFWLQYHLWGDAVAGYHLVNIVLHALSAFLLALILRRLAVPGALLAAAIFALHPVHVESVAWISELKNTLSTAFYLAAALAFLKFDETRDRRTYAAAFAFFVCALLAKTVTATLPAALLVVFWWRRGTVRWRRDAVPLLPFFAVAAAAGFFTAWVERNVIGAHGNEFELNLVERFLLAGRAIWFYITKLVWPAELSFTYERWQISDAESSQYAYPLAVIALLVALWLMRRRARAPLAALLLFCGGLFPALGFFNVYPFRYAYVADHFQYIASIPVIALFAAGVVAVINRLPARRTEATIAALLVVVLPLTVLSRHQSSNYASAETLYRATIETTPSAWLAHNNLGRLLMNDGRVEEGRAHLLEALRLAPAIAEHHLNLGRLLVAEGALEQGMEHLSEAVRIDPRLASARNNLAVALLRMGRLDDALAQAREALRLDAQLPEARHNLALIHHALGVRRLEAGAVADAAAQFRAALEVDPALPQGHNDLGATLQLAGQLESAIHHFTEAIALRPDYANAHFNLANALFQSGQAAAAIPHYEEAVRLNPDDAAAQANLAHARATQGR